MQADTVFVLVTFTSCVVAVAFFAVRSRRQRPVDPAPSVESAPPEQEGTKTRARRRRRHG